MSTHTSKYGAVFHEYLTHESLTEGIQTRTLRERSTIVSGMNMIRALFMRDMNVGRQWTNVDVRGFEPVQTHKH
jgi:hypothetical protein